MSVDIPQYETSDLQGTTVQENGTVGTTAINVPTVATTKIAEFLVKCRSTIDGNTGAMRLLVSLNGGTTFFTLTPGEFISGNLHGGATQIQIKGNVAGVSYMTIFLLELSSA